MIWSNFSNQTSFSEKNIEYRFSKINGAARLESGIRGITSNRIYEAIVTLPYELEDYKKYTECLHLKGL